MQAIRAVFGQIDPIGVYLTEDCSRKSAGADFGEPRSGVGAKPREVGSALFRSGRRGGVSRSGVYAAEKGASLVFTRDFSHEPTLGMRGAEKTA